jgi:hypothetical protein
MKKQTNPDIKAHLIRSAFYVLLLLAVCVIPFALAQRNAIKQRVAKPTIKSNTIPAQKSFTSRPTGVCSDYVTSTSTDTIVPGDTDTGNHCDQCTTSITFPFPVTLYGTSYTTANVSSNGNLQFDSSAPDFDTFCSYPNSTFGATVFPYQANLVTSMVLPGCETWFEGCGVFTATTGTAPNRTFYIEWHAVHVPHFNAAAESFHVFFYANAAGDLPGGLVATWFANPYSGGANAIITLTSRSSSVQKPTGSRCKPGRTLVRPVNGSGTTGPLYPAPALPGKEPRRRNGRLPNLGPQDYLPPYPKWPGPTFPAPRLVCCFGVERIAAIVFQQPVRFQRQLREV